MEFVRCLGAFVLIWTKVGMTIEKKTGELAQNDGLRRKLRWHHRC